jgi:hypothetical protein
MKKVALLCALICAGQLYGMEKEEAVGIYTSPLMLPEIKQQILNVALAASKNVDEAINVIKNFSVMHQVPFANNFQNFIKFVNLLAKRFPELTKSVIAKKLNPSLAKQYDELNMKLLNSACDSVGDIAYLLKQGAAVNYVEPKSGKTILHYAISCQNIDGVKLLVNSGVNLFYEIPPERKNLNPTSYVDFTEDRIFSQKNLSEPVHRLTKIKELLEQAMKK